MIQNKFRVDSKAEYSIRVSGHLDESWSDRLNGLAIVQQEKDSQKLETTLRGSLMDQAALLGVLNTLYNMRLPLISVECQSVEGKQP